MKESIKKGNDRATSEIIVEGTIGLDKDLQAVLEKKARKIEDLLKGLERVLDRGKKFHHIIELETGLGYDTEKFDYAIVLPKIEQFKIIEEAIDELDALAWKKWLQKIGLPENTHDILIHGDPTMTDRQWEKFSENYDEKFLEGEIKFIQDVFLNASLLKEWFREVTDLLSDLNSVDRASVEFFAQPPSRYGLDDLAGYYSDGIIHINVEHGVLARDFITTLLHEWLHHFFAMKATEDIFDGTDDVDYYHTKLFADLEKKLGFTKRELSVREDVAKKQQNKKK